MVLTDCEELQKLSEWNTTKCSTSDMKGNWCSFLGSRIVVWISMRPEWSRSESLQEQRQLRSGGLVMEEPVSMMLLDAIFTDAPVSAPAAPPSVCRNLFSYHIQYIGLISCCKNFTTMLSELWIRSWITRCVYEEKISLGSGTWNMILVLTWNCWSGDGIAVNNVFGRILIDHACCLMFQVKGRHWVWK